MAQQDKVDNNPKDEEIKLKDLNCYMTNEDHQTFFLTLDIDDRLLHNCMLDSRASTNVMTKKVMDQLNLRISRPYHNICSMDSKKIEVLSVVKDLQISLANYPYKIITMDIAIIDVPDVWGMLLSRKFAVDSGGSIQMDLSYATIPAVVVGMARLYKEVERRYHVENPRRPDDDQEIEPQGHPSEHNAVVTEFLQPIYHFSSSHLPFHLPSKRRRFHYDKSV